MKNHKKIMTTRLLAAILLLAVCMAGCAAPAEPNSGVPSETDAPAESDGSGAPTDAPQALTLPILDEIDADVAVGTAGSSLLAVQAAAKLLDWGVNTGLDTDEIGTAASVWLSAKNEGRTECLQKLELVDDAYQKLLTDEARELLDDAGCAEVEITWGSEPVEPVEAIMRSAGLRDADSGDDAAWDVAGFEKSLLENYGVYRALGLSMDGLEAYKTPYLLWANRTYAASCDFSALELAETINANYLGAAVYELAGLSGLDPYFDELEDVRRALPVAAHGVYLTADGTALTPAQNRLLERMAQWAYYRIKDEKLIK